MKQKSNNLEYIYSNNPQIKTLIMPPKTIRFKENLKAEVTDIKTEDFVKRFNMVQWVETNVIAKGKEPELPRDDTMRKVPLTYLVGKLEQAKVLRDHLVVTNMEGDVGCGVLTTKAIKKNSIVTTYSGLIQCTTEFFYGAMHEGDYVFGLCQNEDNDIRTSVNAERYGNISRFIQHAPSSLDEYVIRGNAKIVTANLFIIDLEYGGYSTTCLVANRDIQPKEMLFWDYGKNYWLPCKKAALFSIYGELIDPNLYTLNSTKTESSNFKFTLDDNQVKKNSRSDGKNNLSEVGFFSNSTTDICNVLNTISKIFKLPDWKNYPSQKIVALTLKGESSFLELKDTLSKIGIVFVFGKVSNTIDMYSIRIKNPEIYLNNLIEYINSKHQNVEMDME